MEKRNNHYQPDFQEVSLKDGTEGSKKMSFTFINYDDPFEIFARVKTKNIFEDEPTAHEFALGLKLFTEVMITEKGILYLRSSDRPSRSL